MKVTADTFKRLVKTAAKDMRPVRPDVGKVTLLIAVSLLTAVLFFPALTFFGFNYEAGDVAVMDMKSPVDMAAEGFTLKRGETIVREGERITAEALNKLELIETAMKDSSFLLPAAGLFVFTVLFIAVVYLFASRNIKKFAHGQRDLLLMAVIFLGVMFLLRLFGFAAAVMQAVLPVVPETVYIYMIPVAVGPMLVRLFLNSETAFVFAAVLSIMAGLFLGWSLAIGAYFFIGGVVAAMEVRHATQRSTMIKAGFSVGAINAVALLGIAAVRGGATGPVFSIIAGFLNGLITAVLAVGLAPLIEMLFRYTTNIKLLELSRMDHPLLKGLAVQAPGTYHHSIVIGTLVESAAEAIGANPLLARVSAYYHDIGKARMPLYFIENVNGGENKHEKLTPSMSALVLTKHIKEGVEMAGDYGLGNEITDVIRQHHGTSLITYFYQKAKEQEDSGVHEVNEKDFRYPGPRPQTREAGIVMLADAIEAASKTLPDPTPTKIQGMTQKIVNRIFVDGQLDECELTLKDLHLITGSFNRVLSGIYHQRIDYPEPAYIEKEGGSEGPGTRPDGEEAQAGEDKKGGRGRLRRLGVN
ncbi:MAG: HDIG domain-containing metalloprotein [Thermodesulfobacteriota bacterium]